MDKIVFIGPVYQQGVTGAFYPVGTPINKAEVPEVILSKSKMWVPFTEAPVIPKAKVVKKPSEDAATKKDPD
jgi:hypothetical protein